MAEGVVEEGSVLAHTLATWVYVLHAAGIHVTDDTVRDAVARVDGAATADEGEALAKALVSCVQERLDAANPASVRSVVSKLFGEERLVDTLGTGSREHRTQRIRSYQFHTSLPWLANLWIRGATGGPQATWLLIDGMTDRVVVLDPNPWDEIEESRTFPITDFHVLWELTGCESLAIK